MSSRSFIALHPTNQMHRLSWLIWRALIICATLQLSPRFGSAALAAAAAGAALEFGEYAEMAHSSFSSVSTLFQHPSAFASGSASASASSSASGGPSADHDAAPPEKTSCAPGSGADCAHSASSSSSSSTDRATFLRNANCSYPATRYVHENVTRHERMPSAVILRLICSDTTPYTIVCEMLTR